MYANIMDAAIDTGRHAALRMSLRDDPTDADREEILVQARAVLELTLEKLGFTAPADLEEATAIMVDTYMGELARLTGGTANA